MRVALFFSSVLVTLTSASDLPKGPLALSPQFASVSTVARTRQQHTILTFADRVAHQRAIEEVYWRHRIWLKEHSEPKPSLDKIMSQEQIAKKVEHYLRDSQILENYRHEPLGGEQLQSEMERMARHTKQPRMLREIFEALGNDPFVIAECLARPILAERLYCRFSCIQ